VSLVIALGIFAATVQAQPASKPTPSPNPRPPQTPSPNPTSPQTRPGAPFELSEYGVSLQPDARLIIVMAALEAAGFDPTPAGKEPAAFRVLVRKDLANLDPNLRQRLKTYFEQNKLPAPATAADQAARYVSLAYALS